MRTFEGLEFNSYKERNAVRNAANTCSKCRYAVSLDSNIRTGICTQSGSEKVVDLTIGNCPIGKWDNRPTELTISAKTRNVAKAAATAAKSIVKTSVLRRGRVSDDLYKKRLNTCTNCPGNHAVFKNGALHTCGQFKDSITGKLPTCGCVLTKKARDESQNCPMGYWANLTIEGK